VAEVVDVQVVEGGGVVFREVVFFLTTFFGPDTETVTSAGPVSR
jgi:hypothetical protein